MSYRVIERYTEDNEAGEQFTSSGSSWFDRNAQYIYQPMVEITYEVREYGDGEKDTVEVSRKYWDKKVGEEHTVSN